jgi:hypothetical protein
MDDEDDTGQEAIAMSHTGMGGTFTARWGAAREVVVGGSVVAATEPEVRSAMPGDHLVKHPKLGFTRVTTIDAHDLGSAYSGAA